jgi:hypothetical protein
MGKPCNAGAPFKETRTEYGCRHYARSLVTNITGCRVCLDKWVCELLNQLVVLREPIQNKVCADTTSASGEENPEIPFGYIAIFVIVLNNPGRVR